MTPADHLTGPLLRQQAGEPSPRPVHPASERVYLGAGEAVRIPLSRMASASRSPVVLRADHGGVLEGASLSPQVEIPADAASFTFQAGEHRGLYTVSVSTGTRTEIL